MRLTRRATLTLACLAVLPRPLRAAGCVPLLPRLSLCETADWQLTAVEGVTASLTHASGLNAQVTLMTGRSEDELMWDGWQASHAPISARAEVLDVGMTEVVGLYATTAAYRPRHMKPTTVIAMTSVQGNGLSLTVTSQSLGETYSDQHRRAHAALLAALQLDPIE